MLKRLIDARDTVTSTSATWANRHNVSPDFVAKLNERWAGTAYHRQELLGEVIEDFEGALWKRAELEALRRNTDAEFDRVVVAVDPPASVGIDAASCGVVAVGAFGEGAARQAVVLADASVQGAAPHEWAARVATLARSVGADAIVPPTKARHCATRWSCSCASST
jgi:phage terminase large subunit-like protein